MTTPLSTTETSASQGHRAASAFALYRQKTLGQRRLVHKVYSGAGTLTAPAVRPKKASRAEDLPSQARDIL